MKEEILKQIKESLKLERKGRNSMGVDERFYNSYYLIAQCFKEDELNNMSESELENLIKLADYAGDMFY